MTQELFNYAVTVTAPHEYPVEVYIGYLADKQNKMICGLPRVGTEQAGWQGDGTKGGMGGSQMPYHLNMTYVAYAEKKFYNVDADLPADKILAAFRKGYDRKERNGDITHETYDVLTVGAAPGGVIVVWLSGNKSRTEICRLQAKETFVDKNDFMGFIDKTESQQDFFDSLYDIVVPDSIRTEIAKEGIPFGRWDKYRERFRYRFVFKPYDQKDKFTHNYYLYYNGEQDELLQDELDKQAYYEKGIPYNCTFIFTQYNTRILFNDLEMLQVFGKLKANHPDDAIDIIIQPSFMYKEMKLSAKSGNEEIELKKYKVVGVWGGMG